MSKLTVPVWGNVASEPMHVVGPNGTPRTTFRLAHTARKRQPDGSYANGVTSFFNVTCFGYVALNVAASVHRGDPVVLFGEMAVREWSEGTRSGREVDLVALHIGLNLRWGRARFERPSRAGRDDHAADDQAADDRAVVDRAAVDQAAADRTAGDRAPGEVAHAERAA